MDPLYLLLPYLIKSDKEVRQTSLLAPKWCWQCILLLLLFWCPLLFRGSFSLWIKLLWMKNSQRAQGCWAARVPLAPCTTSPRRKVEVYCESVEHSAITLCWLLCAKCCISSLPEVGSLKFHRYSQERTMSWLKKKVGDFIRVTLTWKCACVCVVVFMECPGPGGEDGDCPQEEKYLCGRRSEIHNIRQSEVRVGLQWG